MSLCTRTYAILEIKEAIRMFEYTIRVVAIKFPQVTQSS